MMALIRPVAPRSFRYFGSREQRGSINLRSIMRWASDRSRIGSVIHWLVSSVKRAFRFGAR